MSFSGLLLRTHSDNNVAAQKIHLIRADEIVMEDGTRVSGWRNLVADPAVIGAGGLDQGIEQPNRWYEVYAIRRSSDGARAAMLHLAKRHQIDQSQLVANTAAPLRDSAARARLAQRFTLGYGGKIEFVDLMLSRVGTPTNNDFWITIEGDSPANPGSPDGIPLATSDKKDCRKVATQPCFVRMVFRDATTFAANGPLHLVLHGDYAISGANYLRWHGSDTDQYSGQAIRQFDGTSWSGMSSIWDGAFRIYVTQDDAAPVMPDGYDQKRLISYVRTSNGDFFGFMQLDRDQLWESWQEVSTSINATPHLYDISAFVPPVPCFPKLAVNRAGSWGRVAVAGAPLGFAFGGIGTSEPGWGSVMTFCDNPGQSQRGLPYAPLCEYQGIHAITDGANSASLYAQGFTF